MNLVKTISYRKNKYGFIEILDKPSGAELAEYYSKEYYQNEQGNYRSSYSQDELNFFKIKNEQRKFVIESVSGLHSGSFLDIGCGEGFTLKYFSECGYNTIGLDYSSFGCEKMNPDQVKNLIVGDISESIDNLEENDKKFEVVWMNNLLEHVIDPEEIITKSKNILSENGVLVIQVPNDFSPYQEFLEEKGHVDEKFWIAYPDHLNYFNRSSLKSFVEAFGFEEKFVLADFPIDIFLANDHSNYIKDRTKGKLAHQARIDLDNLFHSFGLEKTIDFYRAMAELGVGRQIIGFFQPKPLKEQNAPI
ncbi:MAG: class I SAM-dependent methyltransferase [Cyclobacteriaceae bacterium]